MTKKMMGFRLEEALLERARNAVFAVGKGWTMGRIVEEGMVRILEELEQKHNKGKQFPQREEELPGSPKKAKDE